MPWTEEQNRFIDVMQQKLLSWVHNFAHEGGPYATDRKRVKAILDRTFEKRTLRQEGDEVFLNLDSTFYPSLVGKLPRPTEEDCKPTNGNQEEFRIIRAFVSAGYEVHGFAYTPTDHLNRVTHETSYSLAIKVPV